MSWLIIGVYEGVLWKKGKDNGQFLKRKFVLSEQDFTLKYYKEDVSTLFCLLSSFSEPCGMLPVALVFAIECLRLFIIYV